VKPVVVQAPAAQAVPWAHVWHLPLPSQVPSFPQEVMAAAGHSVAFREVPALSGAHMPSALPVFSIEHP